MEDQKQGLLRLEEWEIAQIYEDRMCRDFPKSELKPLEAIERMRRQGMYDCLGFYEDGQMTAYAFSVTDRESGYLLLDYLAVCEDCRGSGHGSRCLQEMKRFYAGEKGLLLECESLESTNDMSEREVRTRRIRFYERSGCMRTAVRSQLFGVEFEILYLPLREEKADVKGELERLYRKMLPGSAYEKHVLLFMDNVS